MVICPKCDHVRPKDATNPAWQCPACGVCYAKVGPGAPSPSRAPDDMRLRERLRPAPDTPAPARQDWNLGLVAKVVVLVALGWGLTVAIQHRQQPGQEEVEVAGTERPAANDGSSDAFANAIIKAADTDAGALLQNMTVRLEKSCARNKYGLSESACIDRLRTRGDQCANETAARFPEKISNADEMQPIVRHYTACVFER